MIQALQHPFPLPSGLSPDKSCYMLCSRLASRGASLVLGTSGKHLGILEHEPQDAGHIFEKLSNALLLGFHDQRKLPYAGLKFGREPRKY